MKKENSKTNKSALLLFKENESNISELYATYAKKIPQKRDFWERLSEEEIAHAAYINECYMGDYIKSITKNNFSDEIISYLMDFVIKENQRAQTKKTLHRNAILTALRIERSMLEEKYFEIFTPEASAIKRLFQKLTKETERHIDILEKELIKISNAK